MRNITRVLLWLLVLFSMCFSALVSAQQKEEPKPYKLTPAGIDYCKTSKDNIQIRIKLKLQINNTFKDRILIHSLEEKYPNLTRIYKTAVDLSANRPHITQPISRFVSIHPNKSVDKMMSSDLLGFFTVLGPTSSYEEVFDYSVVVSRQEYSSFGDKNYYLKVLFESYWPDEVEDLIIERMKPFNPVFLRGFLSEPILVEIKDFNSLPRCE